jgi:hypothetical protein
MWPDQTLFNKIQHKLNQINQLQLKNVIIRILKTDIRQQINIYSLNHKIRTRLFYMYKTIASK